jgi:hypothetical protein
MWLYRVAWAAYWICGGLLIYFITLGLYSVTGVAHG